MPTRSPIGHSIDGYTAGGMAMASPAETAEGQPGPVATAHDPRIRALVPPEMQQADFPPSQDPPGFVRAAFQKAMDEDITAFLGRARR